MSKVEFLGKMPDPFKKSDGTRMTPQEFLKEKKRILDEIVDTEFGGMPPRAEYVEIEQLAQIYRGHTAWYKVYAGTKEKQVSFTLGLAIPYNPEDGPGYDVIKKYPVILTGDGCYDNMESESIKLINEKGFIAGHFNRLEVANDVKGSREGGIHNIYEGRYSDISAWAWAYMTCMDALEKIPYIDTENVAITGHSRGGKTVMLAAAVDERFKYVCPNNSGCHGAVSHRCKVTEQGENKVNSETMEGMFDNFPTWMSDKLEEYKGRVQDLPYDMHYFGAMVAPRYYMQCEGMQDYWINPRGAWQNFMAVKECYKYLGCADHAGAWFRPGAHRHKFPEYEQFLDFVYRAYKGLPLSEHLQTNPFPEMDKNFDW